MILTSKKQGKTQSKEGKRTYSSRSMAVVTGAICSVLGAWPPYSISLQGDAGSNSGSVLPS